MGQQLARATRVFGDDVIGVTQHIDRPQRDVAEVPDRCGNEYEPRVRGVSDGFGHGAVPMLCASSSVGADGVPQLCLQVFSQSGEHARFELADAFA